MGNAYCRIFDKSNSEMARFVLREGIGQRGLIISRLFREAGGTRWGFQALGSFCHGKTWKDSVKDMVPIFQADVRDLQRMRGVSTVSLGGLAFPDSQTKLPSESQFATPRKSAR